jgi:hypothetical protein
VLIGVESSDQRVRVKVDSKVLIGQAVEDSGSVGFRSDEKGGVD